MPRVAKALSDKAVQNLKPNAEQAYPTSYPVGGEPPGLYLQVAPNGSKSWLLRITVGRRPHPKKPGVLVQVRREFGLGRYPTVPMKAAREAAQRLCLHVAQGKDPIAERRAADSAALALRAKEKTFAECERATLAAKGPGFKNGKTAALWRTCFDTYVNPKLGNRIVGEIGSEEVAAVLEPIWRTKYPTAKKVRQWIKAVFDYAKAMKYRVGDNPAEWRGCLEPLLGKPRHRVRHFPSLPYLRMAEFMADLRTRRGTAARALEFTILAAARSDEVRSAPWAEFDTRKEIWKIPAERMKRERDHRVPLSDAALALLKKQRGEGHRFPFANTKGKPLSDMTLSKLVKDMHAANVKAGGPGYLDPTCKKIAVPHGFRSSFKDWARNIATQYADEVSELALAHVNSDATRAAYARDELLDLRAKQIAAWAAFCEPKPRQKKRGREKPKNARTNA